MDTHCHLDDPVLKERLLDLLPAAARAGVERYLVPGVDPGGWDAILDIASSHPGILAAPGIHPLWADCCSSEVLLRLESLCGSVTAIGEIGLDYSSDRVSREVQQAAFRDQLRLAVKHNLPVSIHCRKAFRDLLRIMREEGVARVGGLMHAFSGSTEIARECISLGLYISVCGTLTYANAVRPVRLVRELPLERFVLETDAPDMAPEPHRGQCNEPEFLLETARMVAEIKCVSIEEVGAVTTINAEKALRIRN